MKTAVSAWLRLFPDSYKNATLVTPLKVVLKYATVSHALTDN